MKQLICRLVNKRFSFYSSKTATGVYQKVEKESEKPLQKKNNSSLAPPPFPPRKQNGCRGRIVNSLQKQNNSLTALFNSEGSGGETNTRDFHKKGFTLWNVAVIFYRFIVMASLVT